jgi:peptide/nickel transport system substrate-binding protein
MALTDYTGCTEYGPVPRVPKTVYYDGAVAQDGYQDNPSLAKTRLEAHGWTLKNGVMTNRKGQTLSFTLLVITGSQWVTHAAPLYQEGLKKIGISLAI